MSLLRRPEFRLNSQMNLHCTALKPATTALSKFRWLLDFDHPEQTAVERSRLIFHARRHSELHVIYADERKIVHVNRVTLSIDY